MYTYLIIVQELLEAFGVSTRVIKRTMETKAVISEKDIHLGEDHPPAEALNYSIISIKPYLNVEAWKKVTTSCMSLKIELANKDLAVNNCA